LSPGYDKLPPPSAGKQRSAYHRLGIFLSARAVGWEMSELGEVELAEFLRLAGPLMVEDGTSDGRRPAPRTRRRPGAAGAGAAGRPAGSGARRNERERNRVRQVNAGFDRLRDHVPRGRRDRKLSKVDTLRAAAEYIAHLHALLADDRPLPTYTVSRPLTSIRVLIRRCRERQQ